MTGSPLIALISATPRAIPAACAALIETLPGCRIWNLLDDRLLADAQVAGGVTPTLEARMERLIDHALREGADGVLLTCSQYGYVGRRMTVSVPVLAPDDAAFNEIREKGVSRILVLASLESARTDTVERLADALSGAPGDPTIEGRVAPSAASHADAGDADALVESLIEAASGDHDAVLLAQYSLAGVANLLSTALSTPVVTGPSSAAAALARQIGIAR